MKILAFGKIVELLGKTELELDNMPNTDILLGFLQQQYPELKNMKFSLAVNKKQVTGNTEIPQGAEVALLPPFSGG
ncbi:MAG: MoaD/ThiS family protein [Mongoliibacter sp.]|uniref:MoaD/ThiS family protein n=1 Tax=Mongoliibacter sp. TaxID=2022438 RepID=UPI0012EF5EEA|nr:MoaD/ThiS family protein [Mongoliibacter sp.]TVP50114.1 MAG: MoaD/ThiS family protein [Mongoliibacter sp.]